jgi:mannosyltransferase
MKIQQKKIAVVLLLLVVLLALGLRFYCLDAQSLWNDEGTSVAVAQRDLGTIARDAAHDIHPPLYYWLLNGWVRLFGTGEVAVRSLSALLGVALVALTYALGRLLVGQWIGLGAGFLAAIHPFQVYYAQEARMYMLLGVLTAGVIWMLARLLERGSLLTWAALVLLEAAGLYTHYSFVFIILVLNLAYALWLLFAWRSEAVWLRALNWVLSQVAVVLLFLPWLPTAIQQVTTWPTPAQAAQFFPALADTWRWLVLGPTIGTGEVVIPLCVAALLVVVGILALGKGWLGKRALEGKWILVLLVLWLGLPVILMFALGLYREAYLKFLLVTTPPVTLLLACGLVVPYPLLSRLPSRVSRFALPVLRFVQLLAALLILVPTIRTLRNYYTDPAYARDGYRDIAAYIHAVGKPGDAVVLNAPGQQDVFGYYYSGSLPVYPLPESRPLDPGATGSALAEAVRPGGKVFCVLWATDESDPQRFVEGWLDAHAYKALDSWYGNVRLAVYAVPEQTPDAPEHILDARLQDAETGDEITLVGYSLVDDQLAAGDIAQITLFWRVNQTPVQRYKVFLHVLDGSNHIVGQRDAEPGGGVQLTTLWQPGEMVVDNYGLPIHPATPPGQYRVEVGMYSVETGQRLVTFEGESQVWLAPLAVVRPSAPAPIAALGMQHTADSEVDGLTLLGYDLHKLGFAHQPDAPLHPEDVLHVNLYWRAVEPLSSDWQVAIDLVDAEGAGWVGLTAEPVGGYSTSHWQSGDVWRGQFNLRIPGGAPAGRYRLRMQTLAPNGVSPEPFLSVPLTIDR